MSRFIFEKDSESFEFQPIHKKLTGFTTFTNSTLGQLIKELALKITIDELVKLAKHYKTINTEPTVLELMAIDGFRSTDEYVLNSYINKIEISSNNPHIKKSLDIYNKINTKYNVPSGRTLESFFELAISELSSQNLGTIKAGKNNDILFCCKGTGEKESKNLYININQATSFSNDISSVEKVVYLSAVNGFEPLVIVENTINKETSHETIAEISDKMDISCILQIPFINNSTHIKGVNEVVLLKTSNFKSKGKVEHNYGDRILLVFTGQQDPFKGLDFCNLANEGAFYHFDVKPYTCEYGLFNALAQISKGVDIVFDKLPVKTASFDDFFLKPTQQVIVVPIKLEEKFAFTEFCEQRGFSVFDVGKIVKNKAIRLIKGPITIFNVSHKLLFDKYDETVLRIENNSSAKCRLCDKKLSIISDNECLKFDIFRGGKTAMPQFIGERQNTKSQAIMFMFNEEEFGLLKVFFASDVAFENKSVFISVLESILFSILKLVLLGVPTHHIATTISIYYPAISGNMGKILEAVLSIFYTQMILSIPTIKWDIKKIESCEKLHVISHAVGYSNSTTISNQFRVGQKLFYFPIEKDEFNVPDLRYFLKLTSAVNMQIVSGNIQSAILVESSISESILSSIVGNGLGLSFALSEDKYIHEGGKGGLLIAVSDIKEMGSLKSVYVGVVDATGVLKDMKGQSYNAEYNIVKEANIDFSQEKNVLAITMKNTETNNQFFNKYLNNPEALILTFDRVSGEIFKQICYKAGFNVNIRNFNDAIYINDMFIRGLRVDISKANVIILCGQNISKHQFAGDVMYSILKRPEILDAINEVVIRNLGLIMGSAEGTRTLFRLGYLPYGTAENLPVDFIENNIDGIKALTQKIRVSINKPVWLTTAKIGAIYNVACPENKMKVKFEDRLKIDLIKNAQICSQYVDDRGDVTSKILDNSLGSSFAMSSIMSPTGRIIGFFPPIEKTYHIKDGTANILDGMFKDAKDYFFSPKR